MKSDLLFIIGFIFFLFGLFKKFINITIPYYLNTISLGKLYCNGRYISLQNARMGTMCTKTNKNG